MKCQLKAMALINMKRFAL